MKVLIVLTVCIIAVMSQDTCDKGSDCGDDSCCFKDDTGAGKCHKLAQKGENCTYNYGGNYYKTSRNEMLDCCECQICLKDLTCDNGGGEPTNLCTN